VWFDGSSVVPTSDILRQYAPHATIFQGPDATIRWVGNENGFAPYPLWDGVSKADARTGVSTSLHGDPNGDVWLPVECDVSIRRPYWFWSTTNERNVLTMDQMLEVYYRSVGRGAQLLLNIPADRRGHMGNADFARARDFGAEIQRRFGKSVAEVSGNGAKLELHLPQPASIDHVILQEDCRFGQRIRAYRVEGFTGNQWLVLDTGTAVGHKRIVPVPAHKFSALRLAVTDAEGEPHIRRFAAFNTQSDAPKTWNASAEIWANNAVGNWHNSRFEVDLSSKITEATQYRLRFVPESGQISAIGNVQLLLDGAPAPHLVRPERATRDVLILTITGLGQKLIVSGTIAGAERGTILLQKL
jgi:alpha-L-fucosidase